MLEAEADDVVCRKRPGKGKERGRAGVPGSSCLCLLAATDDAASRRPVGLCSAADLHRSTMYGINSVHKSNVHNTAQQLLTAAQFTGPRNKPEGAL